MRILVTGVGGDVGVGVARILRNQYPASDLLGSDVNLRSAGRLFCDSLIQLPNARLPGFAAEFRETLQRTKPDFLIFCTEAEIRSISTISDRIPWGTTKVIMPGERAWSVGLDKLRTSEFLADCQIVSPWTVISEASHEVDFPCIVKPRFGSGSRAVQRIRSQEDLILVRRAYPDSIIQQDLGEDTDEITTAIYRSKTGTSVSVSFLRKLSGGRTTWAQVIDYPDVTAICTRVAEALDVQGSINLQMKLTSQGPMIFDINPRFSSTVSLRHQIGFRDVVWSIEEEMNQSPTMGTWMPPIGREFALVSKFSEIPELAGGHAGEIVRYEK